MMNLDVEVLSENPMQTCQNEPPQVLKNQQARMLGPAPGENILPCFSLRKLPPCVGWQMLHGSVII